MSGAWLAPQWRWRIIALAGTCLCTGYVLKQLPITSPKQEYTGIILVWLLSFLLYILAVARFSAVPLDLPAWWRAHRRNALALGGLTLLAFIVRAWQIGTIPFVLDGDEASFGIEAVRVISGELKNPFATGALSQPTMSFFYGSLALRFLGSTPAALRIPWMLLGTATIPVSFWLVSRLKGPHLGFITAGLLAAFHYHIHYSRLGLNNIADPLLGGLALLFFYRAVARRSALDWALMGAIAGFALYAYTGARLIPLLIAAVVGYYFVVGRSRFWRAHHVGLFIALGAFLIVAAPIIEYAARYPDDFNGRLNAASITSNGWLGQEAIKLGVSVPEILLNQFRRAALAFNFYPDTGNHYGLAQPLLDPAFGVLFLLGLGYGTVWVLTSRKGSTLFPIVAWWWSGMILGGMLTTSTPTSSRLVTLTLPVCFFIALAVAELAHLADQAIERIPSRAIAYAVVVVFAVISLRLYFVDYSPLHSAGGVVAEAASELGPSLAEWSPTHRIYFFGAPSAFWGFPTFRFFAPSADVVDQVDVLTAPPALDWIPPDRGAVFVFMPGRLGEVDLVQKSFPNGKLEQFRNPRSGQLIVAAYRVAR